MEVFYDGGEGSTDRSVEFFEKLLLELRERGFRPVELHLDFQRLYSFELIGSLERLPATSGALDSETCVILLSGTNCGYGGAGPDGTVPILALLNGADIHREPYLTKVGRGVQEAVRSRRHLCIDFRRGAPEVIRS